MIADQPLAAADGPPESTESPTPMLPTPVPMTADTVPLAAVMVHPANPRTDLGDLTDLEESIGEQGVLQPPIVLPADRVAAAWPDHATAIAKAGAAWVVLIGARRRTAAGNVAGDDPDALLPILIRTDAICDDPLAQLDAMIAENTARQPLTPLEEARAFAEQTAAGRSQREIAKRAGCSQSHVSKRGKLLRLPKPMQADLETGRVDDQDQPSGRLLIKDALAYVDAAGDTDDAAFAMLAAYKLREHRPVWKPDQLVREVRREQARRVQHEALTRKAEAEGVPLIPDAEKKFGGYYEARQRRLDGKKAIATARKDGTLAAQVTDGGLVYYSTAKAKPKKSDNRSEAEQQRITDERERKRAMQARADAAAQLAARPPKLPEDAADIIDALLTTAANDYLQLARRWLLAAGVGTHLPGPDPDLAPYRWWERLRECDWKTRVHAAHAVGLARTEVRTRATYHSWNDRDAAWLARLAAETGYRPTDWEQARLDAITQPAPAPAPPAQASLTYDGDDAMCWLLYYDLNVDDPDALAEHLTDPDDVDAAQAWAEQLLHDQHGIEVTTWIDGQVLPGQPARIAQFAVDGDDHSPTAAADNGPIDDQAAAPAGNASPEHRLLYDTINGEWLLIADDTPIADHDGLGPDDHDAICTWASEVLTDAGIGPVHWQAILGGTLNEYIAKPVEPAKSA